MKIEASTGDVSGPFKVFQVSIPVTEKHSNGKRKYPPFIKKLLAKKRRLYTAWKHSGNFDKKLLYRECAKGCSAAIQKVRIQQENDALSSDNPESFMLVLTSKDLLRLEWHLWGDLMEPWLHLMLKKQRY